MCGDQQLPRLFTFLELGRDGTCHYLYFFGVPDYLVRSANWKLPLFCFVIGLGIGVLLAGNRDTWLGEAPCRVDVLELSRPQSRYLLCMLQREVDAGLVVSQGVGNQAEFDPARQNKVAQLRVVCADAGLCRGQVYARLVEDGRERRDNLRHALHDGEDMSHLVHYLVCCRVY